MAKQKKTRTKEEMKVHVQISQEDWKCNCYENCCKHVKSSEEIFKHEKMKSEDATENREQAVKCLVESWNMNTARENEELKARNSQAARKVHLIANICYEMIGCLRDDNLTKAPTFQSLDDTCKATSGWENSASVWSESEEKVVWVFLVDSRLS